ncbi:MAG TPA: HAMP domain-containing sensor histidine kinase [Novosphingobium sp.]|jgi:signal transduction histidine kinase|nr:HAMP domain-containing sensor histidine kinase [Novosphingobium sp.]HPB22914.1 HAMP domain-containing sensor histidine kinase [Novosphingobium sp.]HPZ47158.1 HAMP domain-containing sensor histidine kinase [Novosphingobium sp.]HQE00550.1 HAMP domain-containing sensor histidine kinase [Novosphingobium sp.]
MPPHTGSLSRRMMLIAAGWITVLLLVGGIALDRSLVGLVTRNFDNQLGYMLTAMIGSAEVGPDGEVFFNRPLGDQRFLEPNSGLYWQISGKGHEDFPSRSLWDRSLKLRGDHIDKAPHIYDSDQFAGERLRIMERSIVLPGSDTQWWFTVAESRVELDGQIARIRAILVWSFVILGLGLFLMAGLQTWYGLGPLRRVRMAIQRMRTTGANRVTEPLPLEVQPLVQELNGLLAHSEKQAEEARTHAGNLAHALKTPLTVVMNAATAQAPDLAETVIREAAVMRRQVDHHLARARAVGRRAAGQARASVGESVEAVLRAVTRLYEKTRFDLDGNRAALVAIERQDLDEILGNLIENAAKYGGGSVFVTIDPTGEPGWCEIWVEDDGLGIPEAERIRIFDRGARLDTSKPGTGLGLAIVRDVAEIYGGSVTLEESEDLGGLLVKLRLPRPAG